MAVLEARVAAQTAAAAEAATAVAAAEKEHMAALDAIRSQHTAALQAAQVSAHHKQRQSVEVLVAEDI